MGDEMPVMVIAVDEHDRVKLSRRRALEERGLEDELAAAVQSKEGGSEEGDSDSGGGEEDRGDRPPRRRGRGGGGRGRGRREQRD